MYRIMRVKAGGAPVEEENKAREIKWEELVCVMEMLEERFGWAPQDGRKAYTRDESESQKSMVLGESSSMKALTLPGEGYRVFDKTGHSDR
jgi:hypothetical protein